MSHSFTVSHTLTHFSCKWERHLRIQKAHSRLGTKCHADTITTGEQFVQNVLGHEKYLTVHFTWVCNSPARASIRQYVTFYLRRRRGKGYYYSLQHQMSPNNDSSVFVFPLFQAWTGFCCV